MHKHIRLRTFGALAILAVGLPSYGAAQPFGRIPFNESNRELTNPLGVAKAAAARVARSKGMIRVPRSKAAGTFLTFDAPGASKGTFPEAVSASGIIVGHYADANSLDHGFLRAPNGTFVTFDAPGAVDGTYPLAVNDKGGTTGGYGDNVGSGYHSFVRDRDGTFTTFDPLENIKGSQGQAINSDGASAGVYYDKNFTAHGFLRTRDGKIIMLKAPPSPSYSDTGLSPLSFTTDGRILGIMNEPNFYDQTGFLLTAPGSYSEVTGPGGLLGQVDPYNVGPAISINPSGEIAGTYFDPISGNPFGGNFRVFALLTNGTYIAFDAADYPPCCIWSSPNGINAAGAIVGSFNDGYGVNHGFWRTSGGIVTTFDVPGAGTGVNQGTLAIGIATGGVIVGQYRDPNNVTHGYLLRPH